MDINVETSKRLLKEKGVLKIAGFGTFKVVKVAARDWPNPAKPGELVHKEAHEVVKFKPAKEILS